MAVTELAPAAACFAGDAAFVGVEARTDIPAASISKRLAVHDRAPLLQLYLVRDAVHRQNTVVVADDKRLPVHHQAVAVHLDLVTFGRRPSRVNSRSISVPPPNRDRSSAGQDARPCFHGLACLPLVETGEAASFLSAMAATVAAMAAILGVCSSAPRARRSR